MKSKSLWSITAGLIGALAVASASASEEQKASGPEASKPSSAVVTSPANWSNSIDPSTLAIMRKQELLQPVVSELYEAHLKTQRSGFAGIVMEGPGLSLYWKGALTPDMRDAVLKANQVTPVQVISAAHSLQELEAEADKISKASHRRGGSVIQAISTKADGSGLLIESMPQEAMEQHNEKRASVRAHPLLSVEHALDGLDLNVPFEVTTGSEPIDLKNRYNDSPPWNSGGYYISRRYGQ